MKLRTHSSASGRLRSMEKLMVFVYLVCLGKVVASSPEEFLHHQENKNLVTDVERSNDTKQSTSTDKTTGSKSEFVLNRQSRALSRFGDAAVSDTEKENIFESVQKLPSEISSFYVIPHFRPGRFFDETSNNAEDRNMLNSDQAYDEEDKNSDAIMMSRYGRTDSLIPIPRFGRSATSFNGEMDSQGDNNGETSDDFMQIDKKSNDALIPTLRFGRSDSLIPMARFGRSNSIIPMARFGRSKSLIPMPRYGRSDALIPMARFGRSGSLIPMARFGRSATLIPMARFGRSNSLIPMARFGRSESLIPMPRFGRSDSLIPMARFGRSGSLIPMARFGRSESLIPMPRFGRSDSLIPMARYGRSGSLIPMARFGRSDSLIPMVRFGKSASLIPAPRFGKSIENVDQIEKSNSDAVTDDTDSEIIAETDNEKSSEYMTKRLLDDNGTVVPYPRLGRETQLKSDEEQTSAEIKRQTNESLIPQIRYGRSSTKLKASDGEKPQVFILPNIRPGRSSSNDVLSKEKEKSKLVQYALLPYPRPGRSHTDMDNKIAEQYNDESAGATFGITKRSEENHDMQDNLDSEKMETLLSGSDFPEDDHQNKELEKFLISSNQDSSIFVIPYPRPGKRDVFEAQMTSSKQNTIGFPHLFKINDMNSNKENQNEDLKDGSLSDFQRIIQKREANPIKADFILPYPRLGRSESLLPYPRLGRSNTVLPYPRPGRSDTILPFPRPGRSDTILPFPRPGRSDTILPFPRPGRSDTILPFPRPGRSDTILPFPRPGRSDTIVPFPRPGRSDTVVPYPRPGRSDTVVPYPRPGRSNSILPLPRPGRSSTIMPYPRLGRSNNLVPYLRPGRSAEFKNYLLPYPRTERSEDENGNLALYETFLTDEDTNGPSLSKTLNKRTSNSVYLLPYSRPGRGV
ncbi:uncharacterized protein CDAR_539941 [Caerostris darwini]|uniref:Uncharacterized protein n=1 Tax=Caerostris darwini TaxID=1538125 RepID=A0AAV4TM05_9ARAC|nr:uncharacterized protein CDAR_539941 [Caerostris darwini]